MALSSTKEGRAEYMRMYRKNKPEIMRKMYLKKKYKISLEDFDRLMQDQSSVCAICKKTEIKIDHLSKKVLPLSVDHCHATGKVRGLLCTDCNQGLGNFKDNIPLLEEAIRYLTKA